MVAAFHEGPSEQHSHPITAGDQQGLVGTDRAVVQSERDICGGKTQSQSRPREDYSLLFTLFQFISSLSSTFMFYFSSGQHFLKTWDCFNEN